MKCLPTRYTVVILTSVGLGLLYAHRIHINLTIVSMVNQTGIEQNQTGVCSNKTQEEKSQKKNHKGEFTWSNSLQGIILSSFYWGYLVVMLPSARLCELCSVKWVFFSGMVLNIIPSLLIPISCEIHYYLVIAMRILQGFGSGATIPATSLILARWVLKSERNTMASLTFSGTTVGMVVGTLVVGIIDSHLGWKNVYYIIGSACIPWLFFWVIFTADYPQQARFIKQEELDLLMSSLEDKQDDKKTVILWKNLFLSKPFWALFMAHGCSNWIGYLLITDMPIYLHKVHLLRVDFITNFIAIGGTLSWIYSISFGRTLDYLRQKKNLSQTWAKRTATLVTYIPMCGLTIAMAYIGCNWLAGTIILTSIMALLGGASCGWLSNHVDIGPKIAATLMALTNTAGTTSGILVPMFVGCILGDGTNMKSWFVIFWVAAGFILILVVVYAVFGSGEIQNYYIEVELSENNK
ncbi:sialin-like [Onthophagus taurus]|uniref:sialin-like n=1 Tax=Onthophagus taurus TaxID=166361 RepID=UPI0039BDB04A